MKSTKPRLNKWKIGCSYESFVRESESFPYFYFYGCVNLASLRDLKIPDIQFIFWYS